MPSFLQCIAVVVSQRMQFPFLVAHIFECHPHNKELIQEERSIGKSEEAQE